MGPRPGNPERFSESKRRILVLAEKTKIFFDGNCIVCDTEVAHYKRIAPEIFDIVDISAAGFDAAKFGAVQNPNPPCKLIYGTAPNQKPH